MSMLAGLARPSIPRALVPSLPPPPLAPSLASPPLGAPLSARSSQTSSPIPTPRRPFDGELLRPFIRRAFGRLQGSSWLKDSERSRAWCAEIGEEVKRRMLELEPHGYKYIVSCSIAERGQGGHGHLASMWDAQQDVAVSETFTNDTLFCSVLAVAVRYG